MRSFVHEYFDGKSLEGLRRSITPDWSDMNLQRHLKILDAPADAKRILEVGCGIGRLLIPLYDRGAEHCVGIDASRAMIAAGNMRTGGRYIDFVLCDGSGSIPLKLKDYFDFAFAFTVFQHIPNTGTVKTYLRKIYRVLKNEGTVTFQVLASNLKPGRELWSYHDPADLIDHMKTVGFNDIGFRKEGVWAIVRGRKEGRG